jgi:hypothetical protein
MNCVPRDIARIVGNSHGNNDRLVEVLRADGAAGWWLCKALSPLSIWDMRCEIYPPGTEVLMADVCLRPIRNPGDDAVDESHAWLPPVPAARPERIALEEAA